MGSLVVREAAPKSRRSWLPLALRKEKRGFRICVLWWGWGRRPGLGHLLPRAPGIVLWSQLSRAVLVHMVITTKADHKCPHRHPKPLFLLKSEALVRGRS